MSFLTNWLEKRATRIRERTAQLKRERDAELEANAAKLRVHHDTLTKELKDAGLTVLPRISGDDENLVWHFYFVSPSGERVYKATIFLKGGCRIEKAE